MKIRISLIAIFLFLCGCSYNPFNDKNVYPVTTEDIPCAEANAGTFKFFKDPVNIYKNSTSGEIYRFTCIPSFSNPFLIRIEKQDNIYTVSWSEGSGSGGYEWGESSVIKKKNINKKQWNEFIIRLNKMNFWAISTRDDKLGTDGSTWLLEGKDNKRYHVVRRWSPSPPSGFYECGGYLISLTDLKIKNGEY